MKTLLSNTLKAVPHGFEQICSAMASQKLEDEVQPHDEDAESSKTGCRSPVRAHVKASACTDQLCMQRFIYSVFTKDTLDEKAQARDTSTHVTFNALNSTKNSPVAAG